MFAHIWTDEETLCHSGSQAGSVTTTYKIVQCKFCCTGSCQHPSDRSTLTSKRLSLQCTPSFVVSTSGRFTKKMKGETRGISNNKSQYQCLALWLPFKKKILAHWNEIQVKPPVARVFSFMVPKHLSYSHGQSEGKIPARFLAVA